MARRPAHVSRNRGIAVNADSHVFGLLLALVLSLVAWPSRIELRSPGEFRRPKVIVKWLGRT